MRLERKIVRPLWITVSRCLFGLIHVLMDLGHDALLAGIECAP